MVQEQEQEQGEGWGVRKALREVASAGGVVGVH